jgi:two-component system, chemotaxis family, chemotaxis protein CheY
MKRPDAPKPRSRGLLFSTSLPVLVVDDKPIMLDILVRILTRIGFNSINVVEDGNEAFEILRQKSFGLIISDLHMAPVSGLELLRSIRNDDRLRSIPFLLMSGEGDPLTITHAKQAGLDNFILKPFTPAALEQKLTEILLHDRERRRQAS